MTVIDVSARSTDSTLTSDRPSSTSQRAQGSVVVGAPAHPVALDNVEVLEVDQWLALLIIGDLDPYTQPVTPPPSLPTRSAKSPNHKNRDREPVHNEPAGHGIG
ncbi:hypothetical protein, partial [Luteimicrobium xylanilyticum]|uniref:hypothetical protein n=1 Tax=Luteimicrobium xylanilyticum TaxID=1133546 RepID=UPI0031E9D0A5